MTTTTTTGTTTTTSQGPFFKKNAFLKFVRHFLVEFVMQLFSHNSNMLIPNLPHAKLIFSFSLSKLKKNGRQNSR